MPISFSTAGLNAEDFAAKPRVSEPCFARVRVAEEKVKEEKQLLVLEVLAATVVDQVGRVHPEFLNLPTGNNADTDRQLCRRLGGFALALGLTTLEKIASGQVDIDFADAVGKEAIVEFVKRTQGIQVSFLGIWALGDPTAPAVN